MSELVVTLYRRAQDDPSYQTWLQQATPEELFELGLKKGQQAVLLSNLLLRSPFNQVDLPDWDTLYGHAFPWVDNRAQPIPWTPFNTPLHEAKVALITTAGVYACEDLPFITDDEERGDPSYRVISGGTPPGALCVKHHLALVQAGLGGDTNHLLPLKSARQVCDEGIIGDLAQYHYSFMGFIPDTQPLVVGTAPDVANRLRAEQVDAVILTPA
jgi:D-proline reductase (dithiol) PrdB